MYKNPPLFYLDIMSHKKQLMNYVGPQGLKILVLALFLSFTGDLSSRTQINSFLRSKRWSKIEEHFQSKNPRNKEESYAIAMALLQNKKAAKLSSGEAVRAFLYFFRILDIRCPQAKKTKNKKDLLPCVKSIPKESRIKHIQRLSAWKSSQQAERHKMPWLGLYLISTVSLRVKDPFTEKIFQQRMGLLIRNKVYASAILLASRSDLRRWEAPFSNFLRARAYAYGKRKKEALSFYFKAARSTNTRWLRKSILSDLKKFYPKIFSSGSNSPYRRQLLSLSDLLNKKQIKALRKEFSPYAIKKSTNQEALQMDGIFLIKAGEDASLISLSKSFRDHLKKKPEILQKWALALQKGKQEKRILKLLKPFRRALGSSPALWRIYLDSLSEKGKKKRSMKYFRELLRYLKSYPYHREAQDRLMDSLIGSETEHINWAPSDYWKLAKKELPHHSASGRFFYWLKRYYKKYKKEKELEELKKNFYLYAPASFYAAEAWSKKKAGSYMRDWRNVDSREDYLRWLTKYGGQRRAWNFLKGKNIKKYQHPKAREIQRDLKRLGSPSNDMIRLLFSLGEWVTGTQIFRELYKERLPDRKYFLRLVRLGSWSNNLNVQIYYLRKLLWKEGLSLDPFSLPPSLSKLLHPRPYSQLARYYSRRYGMNENTAYALIHQESLFREGALSRSGARGLMQIMPRTGKWLAPRIMKGKSLDLKDPDTNIHLGIYYFSRLMKKNKNDFRWASIAYNGGPGNLAKWKRKYYKNDFYHFLEKLPVSESRNYCRITYENYLRYKIIYHLNP